MSRNLLSVAENQQLSLNPQVPDANQNTPPVPEAVTEFNWDGDQATPSKLLLIRQSPLAALPMELALENLTDLDEEDTPPAVDPVQLRAFKLELVRRRAMTVQWNGVSFQTVSHVDVLWSPKLGTGIVLDWDMTDHIFMATEIRTLTPEEIGKAVCANYSSTGAPTIEEGGPPIMVNRNLLHEAALIDLFVDGFEGSREVARQACEAELKKCVQWVDHIDLN